MDFSFLGVPIGHAPQVVILFVIALALAFVFWYLIPAINVQRYLNSAFSKLRKLQDEKSPGDLVTKKNLLNVFEPKSLRQKLFFESAWASFRDTLHEQFEFQGGQQKLVRIRSTVPSANIFNPSSLVDSRLNLEFFKHLPGILTGIGIIGTFWGLINGIQQFDPSLLGKAKADPEQMEKLFTGMKLLFTEVQGAFIASASAILMAMIITFFEKMLMNGCHRKLEKLCRALDALYEGGVGEDYLALLVKHTAENATQTAQLKQSLVTELSELLRDLTTQQIEQSKLLGAALSERLDRQLDAAQRQTESGERHGELFRAELKEGLQKVGETVAKIAGGQGDTVTDLLGNLIESFSNKIQSTFGGQMEGLAQMMSGAAASMQNMQVGFDKLIQDLRSSGEQDRSAANNRIVSIIEDLDSRQGKLQQQMTSFIESINTQVSSAHEKSMNQIQENLGEVQSSVRKILTEMEKERAEAISSDRERQQIFTDTSRNLVQEMGTQVTTLTGHIADTVIALKENVSALNNTSIRAIEKMNDGASLMSMAANDFTEAGNKVAGVSKLAESASTQLSQSTNLVAQASKSLEGMMGQYGTTRDVITKMVGEMSGMLDRAKADAGLNQQVVANMSKVVVEVGVLKNNMDEFVKSVSELLSDTLAKFKSDMLLHNAEFHKHHADTIKQVAGAYQPLASSIGAMMDMATKSAIKRN